jgi:hypothetical protein
MRLVIEVVEIKGNCPVYKVGDRITLHEGYILKGGEPEGRRFKSCPSYQLKSIG